MSAPNGSPYRSADVVYTRQKSQDQSPDKMSCTPSTRAYPSSPPQQSMRPASPASPSVHYRGPAPMYFSPVAEKRVSVLSRPKNPPMSTKNFENLDVQYEQDRAAQERRAAAFQRQACERWHHHGPGTPTILEQGHIVDRGRAKTMTQAAQGVFDPILSEFRIPPSAQAEMSKPKRPSSAPPARGHAGSLRADKAIQEARGVRDPILGTYKAGNEPQPSYAARKQVEFERTHGGGRGIASQASKDWSYNPITGESVPVSPAARTQQRPQSAPRGQGQGQAAGGSGSANVTRADRPNTPSKRPIQNGATWGQYNPINHSWSVPPTDAKYRDVSAQVDRAHFITGSHVRKVDPPARQGVYNPILNTWVVPPADPHIWGGLTFAPATMFSRITPATLRSPR